MFKVNRKALGEMKGRLDEYVNKCHEYDIAKEAVRGVLSDDDFVEWLRGNDAPACPFSSGQYEAYELVTRCTGDELQVSKSIIESDAGDFVDTLRALGVKSFVLTVASSALMSTMHALDDSGCMIQGLCKVDGEEPWNRGDKVNGVRFAL